jgi:hypothetical protein
MVVAKMVVKRLWIKKRFAAVNPKTTMSWEVVRGRRKG